ncbi:MAG: M20 family metallopeptidase [Spirochaetia bacterium]|jgi:succinyl-diaminopimelate desuccinylase
MAISHQFKREDAVRLLRDLVRVPTVNPPGADTPGAELLARELERRGFKPELTEIAPGQANVTARLRGTGEAPALLFNGHIDVVPPGELPWKHPPFEAQVEDGRLYGRGAADMKSGLAAMLLAFDVVARGGKLRGDLIFSAVSDEEIGAAGAQRLVSDRLTRGVGAVVIGEPTGFNAYVAQKGLCWLELETVGSTAHGSMPHLGRNAIVDMQALLAEVLAIPLREGPDPVHGRTTLNIGTIRGGVGPNVVPDLCRVSLDFRLPPGIPDEQLMEEVRAAVRKAGAKLPGMRVDIHPTVSRVAVATPVQDRIVQLVLQLCREKLGRRQGPLPTPGFATDASALCSDPPIPFVIIGPGKEELAHKPDEYVEIEDYLNAVDLYAELARRYLGPATPD